MQGILYEEPSIWQFFFVTCLLGGGAAWMTGRACAQTWRSYVSLVLYLLLLGIAVRFIHHALFNGTMFSAQYYIVDTVVLLIIGSLGFRYTRTNQMVTQYNWLYERSSPLGWKPKG
jgi:ABC-type Fe3+-siderophore transport system permease subunit